MKGVVEEELKNNVGEGGKFKYTVPDICEHDFDKNMMFDLLRLIYVNPRLDCCFYLSVAKWERHNYIMKAFYTKYKVCQL